MLKTENKIKNYISKNMQKPASRKTQPKLYNQKQKLSLNKFQIGWLVISEFTQRKSH